MIQVEKLDKVRKVVGLPLWAKEAVEEVGVDDVV